MVGGGDRSQGYTMNDIRIGDLVALEDGRYTYRVSSELLKDLAIAKVYRLNHKYRVGQTVIYNGNQIGTIRMICLLARNHFGYFFLDSDELIFEKEIICKL